MTRSGFLLLSASLLLAAPGFGQGETPRTDLAQLQGTWLTDSLVSNGKTLIDKDHPPGPGPATKLAYEGDKWLIRVGDKTVASGVFRIDPSRTPKEIDILDSSGVRNDKAQLGIYELSGDTYRYCLAPAGKPRPTSFASPEGSGYSLGVSRREAP
jgi:uncharacterized protein (TIGR03067 family)